MIFVHLSRPRLGVLGELGDSVRMLEALDYLDRTAQGRPLVVNLSVGRTAGSHENHNISLNALGAPTTQSAGLTAADFDFQQGVLSSFNGSFFGKTVGMVAQTSTAGGLFRSQLPASVDLRGREVWLRAAEVYNGAAVPSVGTGYQIGLEDAAGGTSFADSNDVGGLPRPFDRRADDLARVGADRTKTMLKTQRFPAACFARSGFDPTQVRAVLLRLDRGDGRALAFDQMQIV